MYDFYHCWILWLLCDSECQPFSFIALYLIFVSFSFFERLCKLIAKRLKIIAKFQRILNSVWGGGNKCFHFPHNFCFLFYFFYRWRENTYGQFSRKLFNKFDNCLQILIKVLEFYTKCVVWKLWMEVAAQLSLHFRVENMSISKIEK